jgi:hypothetical protein
MEVANLIINVLILAATIVTTIFVIQDHRRRRKRLQSDGPTMSQPSWKIPTILLVCAFILFVANFATQHWGLLRVTTHDGLSSAAALQPLPTSSAIPSVSISATDLKECKEEDGKLKAENARLKRPRPTRIAVLPTPLACPSITQPETSKISADNCNALVGAQQLLDSADATRIQLSNEPANPENMQKYSTAINTEYEARTNLERLLGQLCASR